MLNTQGAEPTEIDWPTEVEKLKGLHERESAARVVDHHRHQREAELRAADYPPDPDDQRGPDYGLWNFNYKPTDTFRIEFEEIVKKLAAELLRRRRVVLPGRQPEVDLLAFWMHHLSLYLWRWDEKQDSFLRLLRRRRPDGDEGFTRQIVSVIKASEVFARHLAGEADLEYGSLPTGILPPSPLELDEHASLRSQAKTIDEWRKLDSEGRAGSQRPATKPGYPRWIENPLNPKERVMVTGTDQESQYVAKWGTTAQEARWVAGGRQGPQPKTDRSDSHKNEAPPVSGLEAERKAKKRSLVNQLCKVLAGPDAEPLSRVDLAILLGGTDSALRGVIRGDSHGGRDLETRLLEQFDKAGIDHRDW